MNDGIAADANGQVSLRVAIQNANIAGGNAATITFDPQVFNGQEKEILLQNTLPTITRTGLNITRAVGLAKIIIRPTAQPAGGGFILLETNPGSSATLTGLTFKNGGVWGGTQAGAILNRGTLYINDGEFANNRAVQGGAITTVSGTTLEVARTHFQFNWATDWGGAIWGSAPGGAAATIKVSNSTFHFNEAITLAGLRGKGGGAIGFQAPFTVTVTTSQFFANRADTGGAIYNSGGKATISDSAFHSNQAGTGGAMSQDGTLTLTNTQFLNNTASLDGGAIYAKPPKAEVTITGCTFIGNTAVRNGGAMVASMGAGGWMLIQNSTFSYNVAQVGAAIYAQGELTISYSQMDHNHSTARGGIVHLEPTSDLLMIGVTHFNNQVDGWGNDPQPFVTWSAAMGGQGVPTWNFQFMAWPVVSEL